MVREYTDWIFQKNKITKDKSRSYRAWKRKNCIFFCWNGDFAREVRQPEKTRNNFKLCTNVVRAILIRYFLFHLVKRIQRVEILPGRNREVPYYREHLRNRKSYRRKTRYESFSFSDIPTVHFLLYI